MLPRVADQRVIDNFVIMPVTVSRGRDGRPVKGGMSCFLLVRRSAGFRRNKRKRAGNSISRSAAGLECLEVHPGRELADCHIFRRRCAGFLEGIHGVARDRVPEQWLESFPVDHIGVLAE